MRIIHYVNHVYACYVSIFALTAKLTVGWYAFRAIFTDSDWAVLSSFSCKSPLRLFVTFALTKLFERMIYVLF